MWNYFICCLASKHNSTNQSVHLASVNQCIWALPIFNLNIKCSLQDDDSLRRWKEKLLGCLESDLNGQMEPEVKFHSVGIISDEFGEITTPLPVDENQRGHALFTLREGSHYRLKLTFSVQHNIVSGLRYSNTVWKGGLQVDQSKGMLGTFAPQRESYVYTLDEETTPSGALARGTYMARLKFEDDDNRCYLELKYSFEIKKAARWVLPEQIFLSFVLYLFPYSFLFPQLQTAYMFVIINQTLLCRCVTY